jgi:protein ImuB
MRRVVSLYLPCWSTDRLRRQTARSRPDRRADTAPPAPLVTALPDHGRRIVASADKAARAQGVVPGMTITRARQFAADLAVVDADLAADGDGLRRLALWAGRRYSPCVAPDPPDGLWIDITGCAQLFGGEVPMLKDIHRRVAAAGYSVQLALADTAGCAHAVARHVPSGRPVIVDSGRHREAIALLPIAALRLDPASVEALRKLGFERVEQLIGSPRAPLAKRFGRDLFRRLDEALGFVPEPIAPVFPEHLPRSRRGLLEPIATADAFTHVIGDLAADIARELAALAKGARRLDCYFHRVDGETLAIRVGTASPSRDPRHLARLVATRLETIDAGLGIEAMTMVAPLVEPLAPEQRAGLESLGRRGPDLAALVDALANRFGQRRLYRASPCASAMPERSTGLVPAMTQGSAKGWDEDLPRPTRMLPRPERIDVTALLPDNPPALFVWRGKRFRIAQADGPERLHGEWWREAGLEAERMLSVRDYFQVETVTGARYWLFREGDGENPATGAMRWFIHGAFA